MPFSFNGLQYIVGTPETVEGMRGLKALRPFDDAVTAFLNDLSGELRKIREYLRETAVNGLVHERIETTLVNMFWRVDI